MINTMTNALSRLTIKNHNKKNAMLFLLTERSRAVERSALILAATSLLLLQGSQAKTRHEKIRSRRNKSFFEKRLDWDVFSHSRQQHNHFQRHIRMKAHSFDKLLRYIEANLQRDEDHASRRGGLIKPNLCLYATLRWLAGASYSDLDYHLGMSKASFYRIIWITIKAINRCPELDFKFPKTQTECFELAQGFRNVLLSSSFVISAVILESGGGGSCWWTLSFSLSDENKKGSSGCAVVSSCASFVVFSAVTGSLVFL
jgi:hypothetical protein